jgi:hypothetical protein
MFNMGDGSTRRGLLFSVCAAVAVLSLAAHFIADAACRSPELPTTRSCHSAGNNSPATAVQLVIGNLHTGVVAPAVTPVVSPIALAFAVIGISFSTLAQFVSPPVQPPKALSIA